MNNTTDDIWSRVTVVTCAKNSAHVLPQSLATLPHAKRIIVVDAQSSDGTPEAVRACRPGAVQVIGTPDDRGLADATNRGAALAETEYMLNINPDTLFEPGAVERLVRTADENPNAAGVAPLLINGRGNPEIDVMGPHEIYHHKISVMPSGPFCTRFITGAIVLWRLSAWRAVGGMDSGFFLYNEDADMCVRCAAAGYALILDPRAVSTHLGGASERLTLKARARRTRNMTWGDLFYIRKHESPEKADEKAREYVKTAASAALAGGLALRPRKAAGNWAKAAAARAFLRRDPPWGRPNLSWNGK
ncbi:MAG: glycosyltransferase family 2 protein [Rhodospirillales bacterium]